MFNPTNYNTVNSYFWQVQEKMSGGADDWSLPADLTLGFLKTVLINSVEQ